MKKNRIKDRDYQAGNGVSPNHIHLVLSLLSHEEIAFIESVFGKPLVELYGIDIN